MSLPDIDVSFADDAASCNLDIEDMSRRCVAAAIAIADININPGSELSILLAGDATLKELNNKWRGKNQPTNVLSFPGAGDGMILGDIVVSLETTSKEAKLENKSMHDHLSHLFVHGFLHLFGYDHETDEEAMIMESLETRIMSELGIADPYENEQQ